MDLGGVIIQRFGQGDTALADDPLGTPEIDGAIETIARLNHDVFRDAVWIVSKCGKRVEQLTREWFAAHDFHGRTGVGADRLRFCPTRAEKAPICRELGVTHFVDDRLEVLSLMKGVPHRYLFQPTADEVRAFAHALPMVTVVDGWRALWIKLEKSRAISGA